MDRHSDFARLDDGSFYADRLVHLSFHYAWETRRLSASMRLRLYLCIHTSVSSK